MNIKEAEELIAKYYEGETNLSEEKLLKEFFLGDDVPEHLLPHQPLFRFFVDESHETLSDEKQDEVLTRRLEQYRLETATVKEHPGKRRLYYLSGIAAGLLILVGLVFVIRNEAEKRQHQTLANTSAELAYNQTKQALTLMSVGLNTGLDAVQHFTTLGNAIGQVQKFNTFNKYQIQFINPERMQTPSINK